MSMNSTMESVKSMIIDDTDSFNPFFFNSIRRSRFERTIDALNAIAHKRKRVSHIEHYANINHKDITEILSILEYGEFIRSEQRSRYKVYFITESGINFLTLAMALRFAIYPQFRQ